MNLVKLNKKAPGRAGGAVKPALLVLVVILSLAGCAKTGTAGVEHELVVLHTNDHHGALLDSGTTGGLAERATLINTLRAENKNVLVLSAGDINTGGAVSNMFDAEPDIKAYNLIGYDAVTLGNHEFDHGLAVLEKQISLAKFPWLSANVKKDGEYLVKPYIIKEFKDDKGSFRVGVFGITTKRTIEMTPALTAQNLTFIDEIEASKEAVRELKKQKVDVIIALTHAGNIRESDTQTTSIDIAAAVPDIDLIIDGHSHKLFDTLVVKTDTPVVSAEAFGRYVGKGTITISSGKVSEFDWTPIPVTKRAYKKDPQVEALIAPYAKAAQESLGEVVTTAAAAFHNGKKGSRYRETALGDLLADSQVYYVEHALGEDVDFSLVNGGNVRTGLPKGKITKGDIDTVVPFKNTLVVLTLKGSTVQDLFDFIGQINQGYGGWAQVSKEVSYTITYDNPEGKNGKISNVRINGAAIDPDKSYKIVVSDYMANGGDGYEVLTKSTDTWRTEVMQEDALIEYIKTLPSPVDPAKIKDGRITVIGGQQIGFAPVLPGIEPIPNLTTNLTNNGRDTEMIVMYYPAAYRGGIVFA